MHRARSRPGSTGGSAGDSVTSRPSPLPGWVGRPCWGWMGQGGQHPHDDSVDQDDRQRAPPSGVQPVPLPNSPLSRASRTLLRSHRANRPGCVMRPQRPSGVRLHGAPMECPLHLCSSVPVWSCGVPHLQITVLRCHRRGETFNQKYRHEGSPMPFWDANAPLKSLHRHSGTYYKQSRVTLQASPVLEHPTGRERGSRIPRDNAPFPRPAQRNDSQIALGVVTLAAPMGRALYLHTPSPTPRRAP